ncbi:MAG: efflux RND transporter periplasmic adaptor subunit [Candidatus Hydrogenedentota bacterium]
MDVAKKQKRLLWAVLGLAAVGAGVYLLSGYFAGDGEPSAIRISGNIEVTDVESSFKIAGWVRSRLVSEGETIEAGDVIAHLDAEEFEQEMAMREAELNAVSAKLAELEAGSRAEEVERARAALEQAQARLAELLAGSRTQEIAAARATVERAAAEHELAQKEYLRQQELYGKEATSAQKRDTALAAYEATKAALLEVRQQLNLIEAGPRQEVIAQARAAVNEAEAWHAQVLEGPRKETLAQMRAEKQRAEEALRLAKTRLSYTTIAAPLSGIVLSDHVESGEYLTPGAPVITIGDLENVWLRGYINETDLGRVKLGQTVTVTTDTYPDKVYEGTVTFISSEAEFTPKNVQTEQERVKLVYRVKIDIPNPDFELKPGMPADAEILLSAKGE